MSERTLSARQKQKIDTSSNWQSQNIVLLSGEFGIESDTGYMKIGNGSTPWNSLEYYQGVGTIPTGGDIGQYVMKTGTENFSVGWGSIDLSGVPMWCNSYYDESTKTITIVYPKQLASYTYLTINFIAPVSYDNTLTVQIVTNAGTSSLNLLDAQNQSLSSNAWAEGAVVVIYKKNNDAYFYGGSSGGGGGSVVSVNGIYPDANGNVKIASTDITLSRS